MRDEVIKEKVEGVLAWKKGKHPPEKKKEKGRKKKV
jgi:hypothetical protein